MNELKQALQAYRQASRSFWATHDRLIEQGYGPNIRQHPDYIAADKKCLAASKAVAQAQAHNE